MTPRVRLGRLTVYLWAGSWTWPPSSVTCDHCRNRYAGPFGVEWESAGGTAKHPPGQ